MELNYCLYCEKRLADDNMVYCSPLCQSNDASSTTNLSSVSYSYPTLAIQNKKTEQQQQQQQQQQIYQMSYHRRPSLCITNKVKTYSTMTPSLSTSSSSFQQLSSSLSTISTSCSCENGIICVQPLPSFHQT